MIPNSGLAVDAALSTSFVAGQRRRRSPSSDPDLGELADAAIGFVAGGKRLRPQFCCAGWLVAGGDPDRAGFVDRGCVTGVAAGQRPGARRPDGRLRHPARPTQRRIAQFEARHRDGGRPGDAERLRRSQPPCCSATCCCPGATRCSRARSRLALDGRRGRSRFLDLCKTEVVAGQFLDVVGQTRGQLTSTRP